MSSLLQAMADATNNKQTQNGQDAYATSNSALVDLFTFIGQANLRVNKTDHRLQNVNSEERANLVSLFLKAFNEDKDKAIRIALWSRDIQEGAKKRSPIKIILVELATMGEYSVIPGILSRLVNDYGRWDDIFPLVLHSDKKASKFALRLINKNLFNPLLCKWLPRKGEVANIVRAYRGFTPKQYRQHLAKRSKVVEQLMSANKWNEIDFSSVPQRALSDYISAFARNDSLRFGQWVNSLEAGDLKSDTLYPFQIIDTMKRFIYSATHASGQGLLQKRIAELQWEALPNYLEEIPVSEQNILPVVDVSGSMETPVGGGMTTAMNVALSLGLYTAQRLKGHFKNHFITFSAKPQLEKLGGDNLYSDLRQLSQADWGMNTDFAATAYLIVDSAKNNNVSQEDMPSSVIVFSDMQFDDSQRTSSWFGADEGYEGQTREKVNEMWERIFTETGYKAPKLIFWNLCGDAKSNVHHSTVTDTTVVEVGGFAPSMLRDIFVPNEEAGSDGAETNEKKAPLTSYDIMINTIMKDRYNIKRNKKESE